MISMSFHFYIRIGRRYIEVDVVYVNKSFRVDCSQLHFNFTLLTIEFLYIIKSKKSAQISKNARIGHELIMENKETYKF